MRLDSRLGRDATPSLDFLLDHGLRPSWRRVMLTGAHTVSAAIRKSLPFDPIRGFSFISTVTSFPFVIAVRAEHPARKMVMLGVGAHLLKWASNEACPDRHSALPGPRSDRSPSFHSTRPTHALRVPLLRWKGRLKASRSRPAPAGIFLCTKRINLSESCNSLCSANARDSFARVLRSRSRNRRQESDPSS